MTQSLSGATFLSVFVLRAFDELQIKLPRVGKNHYTFLNGTISASIFCTIFLNIHEQIIMISFSPLSEKLQHDCKCTFLPLKNKFYFQSL